MNQHDSYVYQPGNEVCVPCGGTGLINEKICGTCAGYGRVRKARATVPTDAPATPLPTEEAPQTVYSAVIAGRTMTSGALRSIILLMASIYAGWVAFQSATIAAGLGDVGSLLLAGVGFAVFQIIQGTVPILNMALYPLLCAVGILIAPHGYILGGVSFLAFWTCQYRNYSI